MINFKEEFIMELEVFGIGAAGNKAAIEAI